MDFLRKERPARSVTTTAGNRVPATIVTSARRLNRAAGTIATSVLIDSAMEHYRGCQPIAQGLRRAGFRGGWLANGGGRHE